MKKKNHLAIIPARSGSKRIPNKNIKEFLGKPIISYSIENAILSDLFDEVMVSTDCENYASVARRYGACIPFLRSAANSNDFAGTAEVALEVLNEYEKIGIKFEFVTIIYPTAPLLTHDLLISAFSKLKDEGFDSVFPVLRYSFPIERSLIHRDEYFSMRWPQHYSKRSQDFEPTFHDAGQFYCLNVENFKQQKKLYTEKMGCLELKPFQAQDIDNSDDWLMAELKFQFLKTQKNKS